MAILSSFGWVIFTGSPYMVIMIKTDRKRTTFDECFANFSEYTLIAIVYIILAYAKDLLFIILTVNSSICSYDLVIYRPIYV